MSLTGFKYFVTFVDDVSRVTCLYLIKVVLSLFLILVPFVLNSNSTSSLYSDIEE